MKNDVKSESCEKKKASSRKTMQSAPKSQHSHYECVHSENANRRLRHRIYLRYNIFYSFGYSFTNFFSQFESKRRLYTESPPPRANR